MYICIYICLRARFGSSLAQAELISHQTSGRRWLKEFVLLTLFFPFGEGCTPPLPLGLEGGGRRDALERPRWLKLAPIGPQIAEDGPKATQDRSKTAQEAPKMVVRRLKRAQRRPRRPPKGLKRGPKKASRGAQEGETELTFRALPPKMAPETTSRPPRCPSEAPKKPQEAPNGPQEASKMPPSGPREASQTTQRSIGVPEIEPFEPAQKVPDRVSAHPCNHAEQPENLKSRLQYTSAK